ncbi:hypothetical protein IWW46_001421 [Coemansia sp. RSA 2440]|nr:hypothetical protein IWW46_001421 [Coemansia sp. RSA 2440]
MNAYLSAAKYILLVAVDQYSSIHATNQLASFLVSHLYAPTPTTPLVLSQLSTICVGNTTLQHKLISCMDEHLESIDTLHVFFDKMRKQVGEQMDEESILGVFVRRCCLAFARMEFYIVGSFFNECRQALRVMRNELEPECDPDLPSSELDLPSSNPDLPSSDPDLHVTQLISALESHTPIPVTTTRAVLSSSARTPYFHYLESLDLVRQRESTRSLSSLRQFFDRHTAPGHHALLHMSAWHTRLQMTNDARSALDEALHIARDLQDTRALEFIACWECKLLVESGSELEAKHAVCAFIESAERTKNAVMQATGYLMLCELQVNEGIAVFETLVRARALAVEHDTQRAATWLAHSRAWLRVKCPLLALLFAQSARSRTERELAQTHELVMECQLQLCGRIAHPHVEFIDPVCTDSVRGTREWLRIANKDTEVVDAEIADECAKLQNARRLIVAGFVAEATCVLNEIVYCPAMPDRAILIAREMLSYLG